MFLCQLLAIFITYKRTPSGIVLYYPYPPVAPKQQKRLKSLTRRLRLCMPRGMSFRDMRAMLPKFYETEVPAVPSVVYLMMFAHGTGLAA